MRYVPVIAVILIYIIFSLTNTCLVAQTDKIISGSPPIEQAMVREGDLAVSLANVLSVGSHKYEIEAETALGNVGIAPRNGWIADYPVTPDIIGELQKSVRSAASRGKLSLGSEEALQRLSKVCNDLGVTAGLDNGVDEVTQTSRPDNYPDETVINNYYSASGPPVVTCYEPPPDYYFLYSWVPYPFWYFGFRYSGYFILNDFHRVVRERDRIRFVSNHFHDVRNHRMFRVDPVSRFSGRTYAGIGAARMKVSIATGVSRSDRKIFNSSHYSMTPEGRAVSPAFRGHPELRERR